MSFEFNERGAKKLAKQIEKDLQKAQDASLRHSKNMSEQAAASKLRRDMKRAGADYSQAGALEVVRKSRGSA